MSGRPRHWYQRGPLSRALLPLGYLFLAVVALRRCAYERGWLPRVRLPVPIIVIGNLTAGGSGKTPLVIALAKALQRSGRRVGVLSRGYGGAPGTEPRLVDDATDPGVCGDEPLLIRLRTGCPVCVHPDRVAAGHRLLEASDVDVLISDDGLQHYGMGRDVDIVVVDGSFRFGNRWPLPAGPLRESPSRLLSVDYVVCNGGVPEVGEIPMRLVGDAAVALAGSERRDLIDFRQRPVHAVAGIAEPERFFAHLRAVGLQVIPHPFPDHHRYRLSELQFTPEAPILMTEKDAVKCRAWPQLKAWFVPVIAELPDHFIRDLEARLAIPASRGS